MVRKKTHERQRPWSIDNGVHQAMNLDRKMVNKVRGMELASDAAGKAEGDEDEFGEWLWDE